MDNDVSIGLKRPRHPKVVVVQEGDVVAGGRHDAGVAGRRRTALDGLRDDTDGVVQAMEARRNRVVRTVIDDDDLEIPEGLSPHRGKGLHQEIDAIAGRDDD